MKLNIQKHEIFIIFIIIALSSIVGIVNNAFFSVENLFDMLKSCIILGIFSLGVLMVLISGDIDISFTAIAAVSMYLTNKILLSYGYQGNFVIAFIMAGFFGIIMGLINGFFIAKFKLPTLIVTLGTISIYRGFLLAFIGTQVFRVVSPGLIRLSKMSIFKFTGEGGEIVSLSVLLFFLIFFSIVVWFLLRNTLIGRGIYALGGDRNSARRVGFNIIKIQFFIYGFVGFLSGIAGIIHSTITRIGDPFDIVGSELTVIAAVVLGGTSITGGRGTVFGTLLGVLLIVLMNNSLILMGITSIWIKVVIGMIIITSTGVTALREKKELFA